MIRSVSHKNAFFFEKFPFWWFLNTGALSVFGLLFFVFLKKKITRLRFHNVLGKVKRKINCYELSFKIKWNLLWLAHVVKHGLLKLTKFHVQKKNSIALCGCFNTIIFIIIIICFIHIMKFIFWVIVTF